MIDQGHPRVAWTAAVMEEVTAAYTKLWRETAAKIAKAHGLPVCRVCGCTDVSACEVGMLHCWWVEPDLCAGCQA